MIRFYEQPRTGVFNGYINTPKQDTVEAVVEASIVGETDLIFVTSIKESITPMWDELGRYETHCCYPLGFAKSRLIKWKQPIQLNLFK